MNDWLLNDILWGWGWKRSYVLTVVFLETGAVIAMPPSHLFGGYRGPFDKWVG